MAAKLQLPPELIKQIIGNFIETVPAKLDHWGIFQTSPFSGDHDSDWDVFKGCYHTASLTKDGKTNPTPFTVTRIAKDSRLTLLNCRLVCQAWYVLASEQLMQHHKVQIRLEPLSAPNRGSEEKHALRNLQNFVDLCHQQVRGGSLGRSIRRVRIDLANLPTFVRHYDTPESQEGTADLRSFKDLQEDGTSTLNRDDYVKSVAKLLGSFLGGLERTTNLSIKLPNLSAQWDQGELYTATCMDPSHLERIFTVLESGLGSSAIASNLTDLNLAVPTTFHVIKALQALDDGDSNALSRIKHLRIVITDETGVSGNKEYLSFDHERDENEDGEWEHSGDECGGHPPSNLQLAYPNRDHQDAFWEWLSKCANLESLGVHATHQLDLCRLAEKLDAAPDGAFTSLSALHLSRIYVTFSALTRLLVPSRIRRLSFSDLIMRDRSSSADSKEPDTWADVFRYLRRYCQALEFIEANDLSYWSSHPLFEALHIAGEDSLFVWSPEYDADRRPYEWLLKQIHGRLGAREFYPVDEEPWLALQDEEEDAVDPDTDQELDEQDRILLEKGRLDMAKLRTRSSASK